MKAVKETVFEILDSDRAVYEGAKGAILEGDLFDAARALDFEAARKPDMAFELYLRAAILYAPVMTIKSVAAFEKAEEYGSVPGQYRSMMARLYERMGDPDNAERQRKLFNQFTRSNPEFLKSDEKTSEKPSGTLAYFPVRSQKNRP